MKIIRALSYLYDAECEEFDYPDYAGLDKRTSRHLSSEFVDAVQDVWALRSMMSRVGWRAMAMHRMHDLGAREVK